MNRIPVIAAAIAAALSTVPVLPASAAAKDPSCQATRWSLSLPAGSSDESKVIIDSPDNKVWRVGAGGVPPSVMLVIEYRSANGAKGELVLQSGRAEFVEGASVTMHLRRVGSGRDGVAVAGTYQVKC